MLEFASIENQVKKDTPPMFIWHTAEDTSVSMENLLFLDKVVKEIDTERNVIQEYQRIKALNLNVLQISGINI